MLPNKRNKFITIGILCSVCIVVMVSLLKSKSEFTDNAYLKSDIVIIRPKVSGYIIKAISNDNQFLKAGQLIAKIDDRDYKLKVLQAEENVKIAKIRLNALAHKINIQSYEVDNSVFSKDSAKASLERANKELNRARELIKAQAVSQASLDKSKEVQNNSENAYSKSLSNFEASKHKQEVSFLEYEEAKSSLKSYEAALELANIDLENTEIKAITDGRVSKKSLQVGQLVSPNISLAYLVQSNIWVMANFKEVQIGKMRVNQPVIVTVDSFKGKEFRAKVNSLSPATGSEFSILPPENATGNFTKIVQRVPVKITFDEGQDLSLLKTGLSCEVNVKLM